MKSVVCLLYLYIIVGLSKIAEIFYLQRDDNVIINNWTCNITRLKHYLFEFNCSFKIAVVEHFFKIVNNSDFMEVLRLLFFKTSELNSLVLKLPYLDCLSETHRRN